MTYRFSIVLALLLLPAVAIGGDAARQPPGIVIDHLPASSRCYVGSPSIVILADGTLIASHDLFGPGSGDNRTVVFASHDSGKTWGQICGMVGQWWSTLFVHRGGLYLMGVSREFGDVVIRRSGDQGVTWTEPGGAATGLLLAGKFSCAPGAVIVGRGRIWRAFEDADVSGGRPQWQAFMMSAPVDAELLNAGSWTRSAAAVPGSGWLNGDFEGWLEGNAVVTPDDQIVNILRVNRKTLGETAAVAHISSDGRGIQFDPTADFIHFPGGDTKFTIRYDPVSKLYYSLTNYIPPGELKGLPGSIRNTLALTHSRDLSTWKVQCVLLHHPNRSHHAFQYVDWQFDGDDMIAVSRTAYEDLTGGAHTYHDANYLTFHRFRNFRSLGEKDSVPLTPLPLHFGTSAFTITGADFELAELNNGNIAFSNRPYFWKNVPAQFRGWQITRTSGGVPADLEITATRDTTLFAATASSQDGADTTGWTPDGFSFNYTDEHQSAMTVYERKLTAGQRATIPQHNWSGMLLLIPPATDK